MSEFYSNFRYNRYQSNLYSDEGQVDNPGEDALANKGLAIEFDHIPTGNKIKFKSFITAFAETFKPTWEAEEVFGRADPIYMFKDTERAISLSFQIPAMSAAEAYENLGKVQKLIQFLYPTYKDPSQAQTIVQSPLVRLKIMNFARNVNNMYENLETGSPLQTYLEYNMDGQGLLGTISNLSVDHGLGEDSGVVELAGAQSFRGILPKLITVSLEFAALHEHILGWNESDRFGYSHEHNEDAHAFPYGARFGTTQPSTGGIADDAEAAPITAPVTDPDTDEDELPTPGSVIEEQGEEAADPGSEIVPGEDAQMSSTIAIEQVAIEDLDTDTGNCRWWQGCRRSRNQADHYGLGGPDPWDDIGSIAATTGRQYRSTSNVTFAQMMGGNEDIDPGSLFSEEERELMSEDNWQSEWGSDSTTGVGGDD